MQINHFLSLIGLLLDIIGAFFLAKSFIFKKIEAIKKEGSTTYKSNPHFIKSMIFQRIEAKCGFVYLFLGFSGQCLGVVFQGSINRISIKCYGAFFLLPFIFAISWSWIHKKSKQSFVKLMKKDFIEILNDEPKYFDRLNEQRILSLGDTLFLLKKQKNENIDDFRERLIEFIKK